MSAERFLGFSDVRGRVQNRAETEKGVVGPLLGGKIPPRKSRGIPAVIGERLKTRELLTPTTVINQENHMKVKGLCISKCVINSAEQTENLRRLLQNSCEFIE